MSDIPALSQVRAVVRAGIQGKLPDLPTEVIEWAAGKLSDAIERNIEQDPDGIAPAYYDEVERALRAGNENAILLAMASIRKIGE